MEERISAKSCGQEVAELYFRGSERPDVLLVFCHGYGSNKEVFGEAASAFQTDGYSTLRFDFRGPRNGSYKAPAGHRPIESDEAPTTLTNMVSDLEAVVADRMENGSRYIVLVGHSFGALPPLVYSSRNGDSVRALITVSAPVRMKKGRLRLSDPGVRGLVTDLKNYDIKEASRLKGRIPHLIIHGKMDPVVRIRDKDHEYLSELTGGDLVVVEGAGHDFSGNMGPVLEEARKFIREALGENSPPPRKASPETY